MEEEQNVKKSYEEKKREKEQKRETQARAQKQKNTGRLLLRWIIALVILALLSWGGYSLVKDQLPQTEDFSAVFPDQGRQHIPLEQDFTYNSNPPSSGNHHGRPAATGFYDIDDPVIPDRVIVHNLEHGDIWVTYKPNVPEDVKEVLRGLAAVKVIVTPREANDTDLAVVAWTRVDAFDLDEEADYERRIQDFITRYINRGPERIPAGAGGHNTYDPVAGE